MSLEDRIRAALPPCDGWSARIVERHDVDVGIRKGVVTPPELLIDHGVHFVVQHGRGRGYGATGDLSASGLRAAAAHALDWAKRDHEAGLYDSSAIGFPSHTGTWTSPRQEPAHDVPIADRLALLHDVAAPFGTWDRIVDWDVELWTLHIVTRLLTSHGADLVTDTASVMPVALAIVRDGADMLIRSNGRHTGAQCGFTALLAGPFPDVGERIVAELRALAEAPVCPTGTVDVVLDASQMLIQIHESIGHPLEMDRILGDERNFAGTSFVTPEMVGRYRYGSDLLNITFAPDEPGELASMGWDDDGTVATRQTLIERGVLVRLLGGTLSQARAGLPGVACSRASGWNRPTMDRMGNVNLEPGDQSLADLVGQVEDGVMMETNLSWSIDERRDKFQFGCELGRRIVDGELREVVRKPGYRGRSQTFWRNLAGVGDRSTYLVQGTPFCGKGEPSQVIQVGHATPAALFRDVDVFGGA
jgi:predicted Zn-dependent protease